MQRPLTFFLLAGLVVLSACRSKPKQQAAELPVVSPAVELREKSSTRGAMGSRGEVKLKPESVRPKSGPPETGSTSPPVKPAAEPKPAAVSGVPKEKGAEVVKPTPVVAPSAPVKVSTEVAPVQPKPVPIPAAAGQGSGSPSVAKEPPPTKVPAAAPTAQSVPVKEPAVVVPPAAALPAGTRAAKPVAGRGIGIAVPAKSPPAVAPATEPLRTSVAPAGPMAKPVPGGAPILGLLGTDSRSRPSEGPGLTLPTGGSGRTNGVSLPPPLGFQFGSGTNGPAATNETFRPLGVEPLGKGGTTWREQQLARQAAEQKAREEEQRKLKGALYRFLFKGGTNPN